MSVEIERQFDYMLISNINWKFLLDNSFVRKTTLVVIFGINYKYYVVSLGLCSNLETQIHQGPLLLTVNFLRPLRVKHDVYTVDII